MHAFLKSEDQSKPLRAAEWAMGALFSTATLSEFSKAFDQVLLKSLGVLAKVLVLGAREQIGVRVLEAGEDPADRRAREDVGVDPAIVGGAELRAHLVDEPERPVRLDGRRGLARPLLGLREEEAERERSGDQQEGSEIADAPSHRSPALSDPGPPACTALRFAENAAR
jgi:hypothetical protein